MLIVSDTHNLQAATIRNDQNLLRRLAQLPENGKCKYHMTYECYKGYTMKPTLENLKTKVVPPARPDDDIEHAEEPGAAQDQRTLRSSNISSRSPASKII